MGTFQLTTASRAVTIDECELCPLHSYNPQTGLSVEPGMPSNCTACPALTGTSKRGATDSLACHFLAPTVEPALEASDETLAQAQVENVRLRRETVEMERELKLAPEPAEPTEAVLPAWGALEDEEFAAAASLRWSPRIGWSDGLRIVAPAAA